MVIAHSRPRLISFTEETTFGETQADFDNNGELFYVIDPNVEGLKQQVVDNNNSVSRILGKHAMIRSLKSKGAYTFGVYLHGNPSPAASGSQASNYHIAKLLQNAMGGQQRSTRWEITGGTTTTVILNETTGLTVGMWLWCNDATTSEATPAKITDIAGTTLTVKPPLPFTPVNGDEAYAAINVYLDQDSLGQNTDAQHTTIGAYIKGESDEDSYRIRGGKLSAAIAALEPGNPTMVTFEGQCVDFDNSGLTAPDMTGSISGEAPLAVSTGNDTRFYFGNEGASVVLDSSLCAFSIEPGIGISHEQVPSVGGVEGVCHYNVAAAPGETGVTISTDYSSSYAEEFESDTRKSLLVQVGTQLSSSFAIYYPNLEYAEDPARSVTADRTASTLVFRAHESTESVAALSGDVKQSMLSPVEIILIG